MRGWVEDGKHLIIEGEDNFNNAGFVDTQRAIPARWVELVPVSRIQQLEAELARKDEALREIIELTLNPGDDAISIYVALIEIADKAREGMNV